MHFVCMHVPYMCSLILFPFGPCQSKANTRNSIAVLTIEDEGKACRGGEDWSLCDGQSISPLLKCQKSLPNTAMKLPDTI